ncbi:MAG: O-antigen ligase family protein [Betaproteobacteria bacterium]|nr:O-antigen ligase family protein [Betaproteobacteria bacterium]
MRMSESLNDRPDRQISLTGLLVFGLLASALAMPTVTDMSFWGLCLIAVLAMIQRRGLRPLESTDVYFLLWLSIWPLCLIVLEILHGPLISALDRPLRMLFVVPLFLLFRAIDLRKSWVGWGCFIGVTAGLVLFSQNPFITPEGNPRAQAFSGNPISYGQLMLVLGCLGGLVWSARQSQQLTGLIMAALCVGFGLVGALLSGSRGVWLAVVPMLAPWFLSLPGRQARILLVGAGLLCIMTALIDSQMLLERWNEIAGTWKGAQELERTATTLEAKNSLDHRLTLWTFGWQMFQSAPWIGVGAAELRSALDHQADLGVLESGRVHLHNDALQMLASYGVAGLCALCAFALGLLWMFVRRRGCSARMGLALMLGLIFFGLTDSIMSNMNRVQIYTVLLALCAGAARHEQMAQVNERKESQDSQAGHCQA